MYESKEGSLAVKFNNSEDSNIVRLAHIKNNCEGISTYAVGWYKSRGKTDYVKKNGKMITEEQYIKLLQLIENYTGFKFETEKWIE